MSDIPEPKYSVGERVMVRSSYPEYDRDDVEVTHMKYVYRKLYREPNLLVHRHTGWLYKVDANFSHLWCYERSLRPRPIPAGDFREMMQSLVNPVMPKSTKSTPA